MIRLKFPKQKKQKQRSVMVYYGKPNVAIFNSFKFIRIFLLRIQLCV